MTADSSNPSGTESFQGPDRPNDAESAHLTGQDRGGKKGVLEERPGYKLSMRVMSAVALFFAVGFGVFTLADPSVEMRGVYITVGFLLAAFAPKALQKFAESAITA